MSLVPIAQETLSIIGRGWYDTRSGKRVEFRAVVEAAVAGTMLYRPADVDHLLIAREEIQGAVPNIQVTSETTTLAARRMVEREGNDHILALNFASGKNPGGGFLGGARAQEEDLARVSALYACQLAQPAYYEANRATPSMLYTDHLIYSPDVPFFRDDRFELLDAPFLVSIITSPAPNAGEAMRRDSGAAQNIHSTLESRAGHILAVAADRGHRTLVLGAWGCGVFRNAPTEVAAAFHQWLFGRFRGAFDHVVFAIYDRSRDRSTLAAFQRQFSS
jgi:uncharacterized protein (TIGR02452 family)